MFIYLSFLYITIIFTYYILGYFLNIKAKKANTFFLLFLFAIAFGIIAFHVEPPEEWDLYRHFEMVDRIRIGGTYYLFSEQSLYGKQIGSALLYYLVSLQSNNHLLPLLTVVIQYTILAYIISDYVATNKLTTRTVFICIAVNLALGDLTWTISMIRYPLACSFCALGMYLEAEKNKKRGLLFYLVGISIHPGVLGIIVVRMLYFIKQARKYMPIALLVWGGFVKIIGQLLQSSTNYWLKYFGSMLMVYTTDMSEIADIRFFILKVLFIVCILLFLLFRKKQKDNVFSILNNANTVGNYESLYFYISLFVIGAIVASPQIFMRYAMMLSFLFVPVANEALPEKGRMKITIRDIPIVLMSIASMAYQYVALTSHGVRLG
ncbi:MAG: EpsG family protein [Clostridia bacterium]|nr:EpsG family protein [Clostridia bacterium]